MLRTTGVLHCKSSEIRPQTKCPPAPCIVEGMLPCGACRLSISHSIRTSYHKQNRLSFPTTRYTSQHLLYDRSITGKTNDRTYRAVCCRNFCNPHSTTLFPQGSKRPSVCPVSPSSGLCNGLTLRDRGLPKATSGKRPIAMLSKLPVKDYGPGDQSPRQHGGLAGLWY